jgi:hypothetical protein
MVSDWPFTSQVMLALRETQPKKLHPVLLLMQAFAAGPPELQRASSNLGPNDKFLLLTFDSQRA